ncbi:MAG: hypothetical protein G3I10_07560 [Ferrovum sp.]|nr:hypothetical protein [Ferrovum sp.]NDU88123.1 hypothetical protein [Ferrovum sp.]NDU92451.1 hypothetical protein [Ferrovum sp.]
MKTLVGLALLSLSFCSMAKLPDPLWTPMGNNYQQQFGTPVSHMRKSHHTDASAAHKPGTDQLPQSAGRTATNVPPLHEL